MVERTCKRCGKVFYKYKAAIKIGEGKEKKGYVAIDIKK